MAKNFDDANGEAKKSKVDYYNMAEGVNKFRMVGGILPRYVYWLRLPNNSKNIPVECLAFDRDEEKFLNKEKDWVEELFPNAKCQWGYAVQVIDLNDGKLKVFALKKKLYKQIRDLAKRHLGDPTNPETGWDCVVTMTKTGPKTVNVEYTLDQLACKNRPLNEEELKLVEEMTPIDDLLHRPTAEEQKAFLEKTWFSNDEEEEKEDEDDLNSDLSKEEAEDIPF